MIHLLFFIGGIILGIVVTICVVSAAITYRIGKGLGW